MLEYILISIAHLIVLVCTGDFQGPLFGLFEDAEILEPIYHFHQVILSGLAELLF